MNYIHQLQQKIREQNAELQAYKDGIAELRGYLALPKFHADTTVQVGDIYLRLDEVKQIADRAADDTE